MSTLERPCLRPSLAAVPEDASRRVFIVRDEHRLSGAQVRLSAEQLAWAQLLDGTRTLRELQYAILRHTGGKLVPLEELSRLVEVFEQALFLDTPRFRAAAAAEPIRAPVCLGVYEEDPDALRRQIRALFLAPGASGLPGSPSRTTDLRAILAPHIDYARGGRTYTWAFKELFERTDASLFVIIGTSHHSPHRFTLTRKHFQTPLGVVPTDGSYIDKLVDHYGDGLFEDELRAHLPEHSIELEVVFLQYLYENVRPIRIVPLVVGSFHDCIRFGMEPSNVGDIGRMIEALRAVELEMQEPIAYIISGDLAHIGPKFRDPQRVCEEQVAFSDRQDQALMERAAAVDASGYFQLIAEEDDRRKICGLSPTYLTLQAAQPTSGRLLQHDHYVHPRGYEFVSFASAAFYR